MTDDDFNNIFKRDLIQLTDREDIKSFSKALFYRNSSGAALPRYKHHVLNIGDADQALIDMDLSSSRILEPSNNGKGTCKFLRIEAMGGWDCNSVWAAVSIFQPISTNNDNSYKLHKFCDHR
ncbi:MAG: hypothetical protein AAGG81_07275 [Chlamydiota bacterium]